MKDIYKKLLYIAVPIMLQGMITATVNLVDVFMIGQVSESAIAAVSLANQVVMLLIISLFGISSAGVIFISQYHGVDDFPSIRKVIAFCSVLTLAVSSIFFLASFFFPQTLIQLFTSETVVVQLGGEYLTIVATSFFFTALSISLGQMLSGMGHVKEAMYASVLALFINVLLNYVLIFGHFGFPPLGVIGAAIATTCAKFCECLLLLFLAYQRKYPVFVSFNDFKRIDKSFSLNYLKTALPVIGSYTCWALGATTLTAIYSKMGTDVLVSISVFNSLEKIASTGILAMSCATGIIIGHELGRNNVDKAILIARKFNAIGAIFAIIMAVILASFAESLIGLYDLSPDTQDTAIKITRLFCLLLPLITVNSINMMGTLKSGGQTRYIFMVDIICMWGTTIPIALICMRANLPVMYVYLIAIGGGELVKLTLSGLRVQRLEWAKSLT
ncbi:MATE family efflux transporter [Moritella sp. 5]|uniref:MATE family efflux transporter n=1 Tax=Moritella sp. 5 TaxID=2746231 RepID=UPI001BA88377|nr:MATE family efflux transporter [Moritella sp. 5]QUM81780.1 MATE family efflux transporter [Moritella sp. 5]